MDRAVVLGASMGGLLAARALSDFYASVLVVERDALPAGVQSRRGVPQGEHLHALFPSGVRALGSLFPGLIEDLESAGAQRVSAARARFVFSGHELTRGLSGPHRIQPTRALLEHAVRRRVADLPGVMIMDRCAVVGLVTSGDRVTGARIARGAPDPAEERLDADLVVDAMGRGGRTKVWLSELGYEPPLEDRVKCDVTYVSRFLRMSGEALDDRMVVVGPVPGRPRAMALAEHENDRWMLTIGGMAGERPPADDEGFLACAKTIAPADVYRALTDAEPLTGLVTHRFPASVRRRYERLRRFPAGLLVLGDSICSFNPIYGQGMTVAALEAEILRRCLRSGERDLARRFFHGAAKVIGPAWQLSARGDLALPEIEGRRPVPVRLFNRYIARLHRAAERDAEVAAAFLRVTGLVARPSSLLRPGTMARVLRGGNT